MIYICLIFYSYFISVEFEKGEDPHLLLTGHYKSNHSLNVHLALSPNGEVVVISTGSTLMFFNAVDGQLDRVIHDVYTGMMITFFTFFNVLCNLYLILLEIFLMTASNLVESD